MSTKKMNPYVYCITYRATGQYYIGSQLTGKMIGDGYYTHSHHTLVRERFIRAYMDEWDIQIISEMNDDAPCKERAALIIENILIKKHFKDPLNLNGWYHDYREGHQHIRPKDTRNCKPPSQKGAKRSDATKERLRLQNTGRVPTPEQYAKMCEGNKRNGLKRRGKPHPNHNPKSIEGLTKGYQTKQRRAPYLNAIKQLLKWLKNEQRLKDPNTPQRNKSLICANRRRRKERYGSEIYHESPKGDMPYPLRHLKKSK